MDGVINIYKPTGMTSFDVVSKVRKIAETKKVGHTGTLDPDASGVLVVCIGNATKLVDIIMEGKKIYKATLKLGVVTDTYDKTGKIINEKPVTVNEKEILAAIGTFQGEIFQVPPMYSALKVNGKKLYELAREGKEIDRQERKINIYSISEIKINIPYVDFTVNCSKGTYIRSLCYDIGERLGSGGTMWSLERIQTGSFNYESSIELSKLNSDNISTHIISIEEALKDFESVYFDTSFKKHLINGVQFNDTRVVSKTTEGKLYRVYTDDNEFIGLGKTIKGTFKIVNLLMR